MKKALFIILLAFICGGITTLTVQSLYTDRTPSVTTTYRVQNTDSAEDDGTFVTRILGMSNEEQASPYDWIGEDDIEVGRDKVVINVKNAQWSKFTNTNSMDPVLDTGANAIQIQPQNEADIHIGDIISYESRYADGIIIHRVINIGYDDEGWYALVKGDNNPSADPGRVRFSQIKRVLVAIIY